MLLATVDFVPPRDLPDLDRELWALIGRVPAGSVTTCGQLAAALGSPQAARWIGHVLLHHEHGPDCPCHRVVRAEGLLGGYPAGDPAAKARRLRAEGIAVRGGYVDLGQYAAGNLGGSQPLTKLSQLQLLLQERISLRGSSKSICLVAGVDVSYVGNGEAVAAYALCQVPARPFPKRKRPTAELVQVVTFRGRVTFPYITSYLTFREMPILLEVIERAEAEGPRADVLLVDGAGILHPRGCGIASMLGVVLDRPTVGVTKKRLSGQVDVRGMSPGESRDVFLEGRVRGAAILPLSGTARPLYVSPGHRMSVAAAGKLVERLLVDAAGHSMRLPLPLHWADRESRRVARE